MNFRIIELCKERGISQKDLAENIGISRVGLSKAINGNPTIDTLEKISDALGVKVWELFSDAVNQDVIGHGEIIIAGEAVKVKFVRE